MTKESANGAFAFPMECPFASWARPQRELNSTTWG
jgi:hypothetical protein